MRLTCPNCGSQYEVDSRVIPEMGRDVQCSSCGHTWFQDHPDTDLPRQPETTSPEPEPQPAPAPSPRRKVDPNVMSVLREEAAREHEKRLAERASALEMQPEIDLHPPVTSSTSTPDAHHPAPQRRPMPTGEEDDQRGRRIAPRRDLLPDIEEINSSLSPSEHEPAPAPVEGPGTRAMRQTRNQGRRIGFGLALALFTGLAVLYAQGNRIGAAVPAFEPPLTAYVTAVDRGRIWLDTMLRRIAGGSETTSAAVTVPTAVGDRQI